MGAVLGISAPVFGLACIGYLAARFGWFSEQAGEGLSRFVFNWATPFLLIRVFSTQQLPDQFPWFLLLSFYTPVAVVYVIGLAVASRVFARDPMAQVVFALGSTFGNTVLLGMPLVLLAFGEAGSVPYFILMSVHSLLLFTVSAILLEVARQRESGKRGISRNVAKGLGSNPVLVGVVLGLTLNASGLALPLPIDQIARYMQDAVPACALFALGASLSRYHIAGRFAETTTVVLLKNLLLPLLVWLFAHHIFELPAIQVIAAVMLATLPSGVNVYLFAERYGSGQRLATTTIFVSTSVSVVTLTAVVAWGKDFLG